MIPAIPAWSELIPVLVHVGGANVIATQGVARECEEELGDEDESGQGYVEDDPRVERLLRFGLCKKERSTSHTRDKNKNAFHETRVLHEREIASTSTSTSVRISCVRDGVERLSYLPWCAHVCAHTCRRARSTGSLGSCRYRLRRERLASTIGRGVLRGRDGHAIWAEEHVAACR